DTRIQPIAVRDVLRYLVGSATLPADVSRRFDIGAPTCSLTTHAAPSPIKAGRSAEAGLRRTA
ncbi:MAG TPA: hypothetical protein VGD83_35905, partial [Streptosporangiaceae bacterium]